MYDVECPIKAMCLVYETIKMVENSKNELPSLMIQQVELFKTYCGGCNAIHKSINDFFPSSDD
jgi:hypothetical protein